MTKLELCCFTRKITLAFQTWDEEEIDCFIIVIFKAKGHLTYEIIMVIIM